MKIRLGLALLFLTGCSVGGGFPDDASLTWPDAHNVGAEHLCMRQTIDTDFYNCGACDATCSASDADRCVNSECRCGLTEICDDQSDCRLGRCVQVDLTGDVCEFDEECLTPGHKCIEGHCSFVSCAPEVCDGIDNDCDGVIDGTIASPLAEWCYSGPETNPLNINAPCSPGVRLCEEGEWTTCIGEVPPLDEVGIYACDGMDQNCDLCVDGNMVDGVCQPITVTGFDVVFVVDRSGSMSDTADAVDETVQNFGVAFSGPEFNYAFVLIPGIADYVPELILDFSDYTTFSRVLSSYSGRTIGSSEPTYDALIDIADGSMGLSYTPGHVRVVIMFTDEGGQSFRGPVVDEVQMCNAFVNGEVLVVFDSRFNHGDYSLCATHLFDLVNDSTQMGPLLEGVIVDPCLETL